MPTIPADLEVVEVTTRTRSWNPSRRDSDSPHGRSRAYVFLQDENLTENLVNRRSRPYNTWRPLVEEALTDLGLTFRSLRWSQRCGCSCPCSPGFLIDGPDRGRDYYLTIRVGGA